MRSGAILRLGRDETPRSHLRLGRGAGDPSTHASQNRTCAWTCRSSGGLPGDSTLSALSAPRLRPSRWSRTAGFAVFALLGSSCDWASETRNRSQQISSYADLQEIRTKVESLPRAPTVEEWRLQISSAVQSVRGGRDRWGNPFEILVENIEGAPHYIVLSTGADGVRDLNEPEGYFQMSETNIKGAFDRDIVFRDGLAITLAGN